MTNEPTLADALDRVKRMACNCISYNAQEWGGTDPETVLPYRKYFPYSERETVCVDACIADTMERLWSAGVRTGACCCGHNGKSSIANGRPSVMIVDPSQAPLAFDVLAADPREWWVQFWAGAEAARNPADDQSATIARLTAERDKWFEASGAHHVASMREAQRADQAEAKLAEVMAERDAARDEGFAQGIEAARMMMPGAIEALSAYQQADMDGIMVLVSRQAIEECLPVLRALAQKGE